MNSWHSLGRLFFGTPVRFVVTVVVIMILWITGALTHLLDDVEDAVVTVAVILLILSFAAGGLRKGGKK